MYTVMKVELKKSEEFPSCPTTVRFCSRTKHHTVAFLNIQEERIIFIIRFTFHNSVIPLLSLAYSL
jgi:hypothetical protein